MKKLLMLAIPAVLFGCSKKNIHDLHEFGDKEVLPFGFSIWSASTNTNTPPNILQAHPSLGAPQTNNPAVENNGEDSESELKK